MAARSITLASETDWPGFRRHARALLAALVPPGEVSWHTPASCAADLFSEPNRPVAPAPQGMRASNLIVPAWFVGICEKAVLHRDPARFGLLYCLLWRLVHEPALRRDPLDAERMRARHMAQSVRRDLHKMKAFVRFRRIECDAAQAPLHVAWFEPEHHIVEAVAPFFVRRFTQMEWAILTPERSLHWDGRQLEIGPGAERRDAPPADAGEALWLTYYAHIFNPARLKLAMMKKEMPVRYWHNLPEAELIGALAAQAAERSGRMVDAAPTMPARRIVRIANARDKAPSLPNHPALELPGDPQQALALLKRATERCRECPIGAHATQAVFGEGPLRPALMVVGEQPGDQEDLHGRPFVGPAGQLFDRAIAQLGWRRDALYITNAVKHFKFELRGKRRMHKTPSQREAAACLHWLESEIEQVQPRALLALGATAARALLGRSVMVMRERGRWHDGPLGLPVLVTLHPSALLRSEPGRQEADYLRWLDDLALARDRLTR